MGDIELARRTCSALTLQGATVNHLPCPTDDQLRAALADGAAAVTIVVRGDVAALRYALLTAHLRPGLPIVVTLFDRTLTKQLTSVLPHCTVTSPASVAVPAIISACVGDEARLPPASGTHDHPRTIADIRVSVRPVTKPRSAVHAVLGQLRSHDRTTRMLLTGLIGLCLVLAVDVTISVLTLHKPASLALYDATLVLATVDADPTHIASSWYLLASTLLMLLTFGLAALFTAALVARAASNRTISMMGRHTKPRSKHVAVVGLGQIGLRVCMALRSMGIPVIAVERDSAAANLRLAKAAGIPVLIAHGEDRQVLEQLSLNRARAIAAMGSDDLDNIEIAMAALAVQPGLRVVLRAGEDSLIGETRPLLPLGHVVDISSLTATELTRVLTQLPGSSQSSV